MKIGIIGAGSIGLLFAAYLSEKHEVTLYTRTEEQATLINREGVHLYVNESVHTKHISSKGMDEESLKEEEWILVAVKQYHLPKILPLLEGLKVPLLFLQNGYGHIAYLKELKSSSVYVGVVEHGALRRSANAVEHTGVGLTRVASFKGDLTRLLNGVEGISQFPFVKSEDYHAMLIDKLLVNAVINPLSAVLGVENGKLIENPYYYQLFQAMFQEISSILEIPNADESFKHVKSVCANTSSNRSSMLKDIDLGKETEIDAILGYIMSEAIRKEKKAYMTSSFYAMIKGKEFQGG